MSARKPLFGVTPVMARSKHARSIISHYQPSSAIIRWMTCELSLRNHQRRGRTNDISGAKVRPDSLQDAPIEIEQVGADSACERLATFTATVDITPHEKTKK